MQRYLKNLTFSICLGKIPFIWYDVINSPTVETLFKWLYLQAGKQTAVKKILPQVRISEDYWTDTDESASN